MSDANAANDKGPGKDTKRERILRAQAQAHPPPTQREQLITARRTIADCFPRAGPEERERLRKAWNMLYDLTAEAREREREEKRP